MVTIFRGLIVLSIASLLVGAVLPFDHTVKVSVELNQTLPTWLLASGAFVVIAFAAAVASWALLRFRHWGRWLAVAVAIGGAAIVWLASGSAVAEALSPLAVTLLSLSALAWLASLAMSHHPAVSAKFRLER